MIQRWKNVLVSTAVAAAIGTAVLLGSNHPAVSGGETRTLSLYHIHTKESITVTYMKDGKYIPSAMKKLNYFLRDWRRNEIITISPKTIDLMWELHADLGSKAPIHIVCGYRSPRTNAFLKSIGRNVARKSQHMAGHAIDLYFPDVPTVKIRNSALVREAGGVGYYSSGGGPTGFLHIDSGRVRHWGPAISSTQMARIMHDYRRTVGARLNKNGSQPLPEVDVAEADATAANLPSQQEGDEDDEADAPAPATKAVVKAESKDRKKIPLETAYTEDDSELAGMSQDASASAPQKPKAKPAAGSQLASAAPADAAPAAGMTDAATPPEGITKGYVPKPRPKPIEVLMMAAVNLKIEPASAPPPDQAMQDKASPLAGNAVGAVPAAETMAESDTLESNASAKTSLAEELRNGGDTGVPVIRSIAASAAASDMFWSPSQLVFDTARAVRRDGAPQAFSTASIASLLPGVSDAQAETAQTPRLTLAETAQATAAGKGDMLVVNREGKGSLLSPFLNTPTRLGQADAP